MAARARGLQIGLHASSEDGCRPSTDVSGPRDARRAAPPRSRQREERAAAGRARHDEATDRYGTARSDLVFTWEDGRLINLERLTRWFTQHTRAAGLPWIRPHDARHSYASAGVANASGWGEVKVVSERLGHASIGITLDAYSHVLPGQDADVAATLARVILGG